MEKDHELKVVSIRMVEDPPLLSKEHLNSPEKVVGFMADELRKYDRELCCVLNMKSKSQVINMNIVSMGTLDQALIKPREVFKSSILSNAAFIVLMHNHPSGECTPSKEDILLTKRLRECGEMLGIPVVDHIITGDEGKYYSFAREGLLPGENTILGEAAAERGSGVYAGREPQR